jgi:hypothetical protein
VELIPQNVCFFAECLVSAPTAVSPSAFDRLRDPTLSSALGGKSEE